MRKLKKMPDVWAKREPRAGRPSGSKYDKFLDGSVWKGRPSDLGAGSVVALRNGLKAAAARRGMTIRVRQLEGGVVAFRAWDLEDPGDCCAWCGAPR